MTIAGIFLIMLHIALAALFYFLITTGHMKVKASIMPFVLLVPFWGCLAALLLDLHLRMHKDAVSEIPMEKLEITDEIFKSLADGEEKEKSVAPLDEVLMLAPSFRRRNMMLDILNDTPEEYAGALLHARSGDDTEVVHYATTAMAEMSKHYDHEIQQYENLYSQNSKDPALVRRYADFLERYLDSGIAEGRTAQIQRNQLIRLLQQLTEESDGQEPELYERLVCQLIATKNYTAALATAGRMQQAYPDREEPRLLMVECLALLGEGEKLHAYIRRCREDGVYFSHDGETRLQFWEQGKEKLAAAV